MKKILLPLSFLALLALSGCGAKNTVRSGQIMSGWTSPLSYSQGTMNSLQTYGNQYQCPSRRSFVVNSQSGMNINTISGPFNMGAIQGDSQGTSYVGVSPYKDIMVVTKVLRGGAVVGFNIEIAFCDQQGFTPPYFVQRQLALPNSTAQFAPVGITLYERIVNGSGSLAASQTHVWVSAFQGACVQNYNNYYAQPNQGQCYYPVFDLVTSFGDVSYISQGSMFR